MQHCAGFISAESGAFKTGTATTGMCVIVAGKSSHHLIRAETPDDGRLRPKHVE